MMNWYKQFFEESIPDLLKWEEQAELTKDAWSKSLQDLSASKYIEVRRVAAATGRDPVDAVANLGYKILCLEMEKIYGYTYCGWKDVPEETKACWRNFVLFLDKD